MKKIQRKIYKLHSKLLREGKWNIKLDLHDTAIVHPDYIVSMGESQLIRWIDELRGTADAPTKIREVIRKIKQLRQNKANQKEIAAVYEQLHGLQFITDMVEVIVDNVNTDYARLNKGFIINGVQYRRLLSTNGGVKSKTIIYINDELYPEIKRRIDNGRNMEKALVPAKLEAYQALVCSGSTPLPAPRGFIVVNDCITQFSEDVILLTNDGEGEPKLTYVDGYKFDGQDGRAEHNDSDGNGLMSPEYSRRVNAFLTGNGEHTISGMNTRYAWTKGMVYTFDFVEFAEKIAGTYEIVDAWGDKRDVRDADIIFTTSMLKLWDCYNSWEDYYKHCEENNYRFSMVKALKPHQQNIRTSNYQFLQNFDFTDEEITELCKQTVDEVRDVLGLDYRKSLAYLSGKTLSEKNINKVEMDCCTKALMYEPQMLNDPYIRNKIWKMMQGQIQGAERGKIYLDGDFIGIGGDLYALCQSMFGLEVTGLLKAGEVYTRYWADRGAAEVACFRAPMCVSNNIRKMRVADGETVFHWFQYIENAVIFNAWDASCEAMSGADKDGDTAFITDNKIILANTKHERPIICQQHSAEKIVPTEKDIITANKNAFNSKIGNITNIATTICELQAGMPCDSPEYEMLEYRKKCCQQYQQDEIDKSKGIKTTKMPDSWVSDAERKPYFFRYRYENIDRTIRKIEETYAKYIRRNTDIKGSSDSSVIAQAMMLEDKSQDIQDTLVDYQAALPVIDNGSTMNRLCHYLEAQFAAVKPRPDFPPFDYTIMRSDATYTDSEYKKIEKLYKEYGQRRKAIASSRKYTKGIEDVNAGADRTERATVLDEWFIEEAHKTIPDADKLTNIVLDMLYKLPDSQKDIKGFMQQSKSFAWVICGEQILDNLRKRANGIINIPVQAEGTGEFVFRGEPYVLLRVMQDDREVEYDDDEEEENNDFE